MIIYRMLIYHLLTVENTVNTKDTKAACRRCRRELSSCFPPLHAVYLCRWKQIKLWSLSCSVASRDPWQEALQSWADGTPRYPTPWSPEPHQPPPPPCSAGSARTRPPTPTWRTKATDSTSSWGKVRTGMHLKACMHLSAFSWETYDGNVKTSAEGRIRHRLFWWRHRHLSGCLILRYALPVWVVFLWEDGTNRRDIHSNVAAQSKRLCAQKKNISESVCFWLGVTQLQLWWLIGRTIQTYINSTTMPKMSITFLYKYILIFIRKTML